ncbi:CIC11C00000001178 [Sungouiella intermedia]|uniref:Rhomboid-type serine protease 2 n=1 Tax=Sungouiella intermedia TaxID=45354 RepID=A0A1L0B843_9ASCO|nr:CIC11C00000001178 [[Candida] intermedia]
MPSLEIPTFEQLKLKLKATPALSVGIIIFSTLFYMVYPPESKALLLSPWSPYDLNLNAISFYIFPHVNIIHLTINLFCLFPLLSRYEKTHGTVYTGVTLNIVAVVTALQYALVGMLLYPNQHVGGLLGECFTFLTYYCYKEHVSMPVIYTFKYNGREVLIPTLYFPFVNLLVVTILVPSSALFGHLAGISTGYLLATDRINFMFPPLKVLMFIEKHLAKGIAKLQLLVDYIREEDAVNERGVTYRPIFSSDLELNASTQPSATQPYESINRRLGT